MSVPFYEASVGMREENMKYGTVPGIFRFFPLGKVAEGVGTPQRFTMQINDAWSRIPIKDRTLIEDHVSISTGVVEIQLRDDRRDLTSGPSGDASAQFMCSGILLEIVFDSYCAPYLSDDSCTYWIAHEIAHLFLHTQNPEHMPNRSMPDYAGQYARAEAEVDALLKSSWGFEEDCHDKLLVEMNWIKMGYTYRNNRLERRSG